MNQFSVVFTISGFLGWLWESVFCTLRQGQWANRGFLFGPVCPIYGFGGIIAYAIYKLCSAKILPHLSWWQIFLAGFVVSMLLEYPTSFMLEKLFHARWWDYSDVPLNINGRTSVPTSVAFGIASIVIMRFIMPKLSWLISAIPEWLIEGFSFVFTALIFVDVTLTVCALTDFQNRIKQFDESFQNQITEEVTRLFSAESSIRFKAIKRIAVFKYPISEKINTVKSTFIPWK